MKRLFVLKALAFCLLFTQAKAQENVTSKTATASKGYTVLNKDGAITIYKYQHWSHSPKEAEKYLPKYFFTTATSDVLQTLSKDNVKKAFPENHPFQMH